jgi:hypothetical protein
LFARNAFASVFGACANHASVSSSASSRAPISAAIVGDERELDALIRDPGAENVPVGSGGSERRVIRLAQRPLPRNQLLADPPIVR